MVAHSALTGASLHEPKGASTASANTVYVSDGAGSGSWVTIDAANIDTSSIKNINKETVTITIADVSTATTVYIPTARACNVTKIVSVLYGTISGSNSIITVRNAAGTSMGTLTITASGSLAGDIDTLTPASNNAILADSKFSIETDGGSTNTIPITFAIEVEFT